MDHRQDELAAVTGQSLVSGMVLVDVRGEVDAETAPDIEAAVRSHWAERAGSLVLDLTGVTFFGSAGLNLLIALKVDCERLGVDLRLVATGRTVLRALELTDLASQFVVVASVDAALVS